MSKKFALQSLLSLIVTFFGSVASGFAAVFVLGTLLMSLMLDLKDQQGKEHVQNLMEIVGFLILLLIFTLVAYIRGKRRTKKEKMAPLFFLKFTAVAMAAFIIPALILFDPKDPGVNEKLLAVYFPYLFLENTLKLTQASVFIAAVLAVAAQAGAYCFGKRVWERRMEKES